ncbi:MAG: hypothetical protein E6H07_14420 [Bacteroidetes bacterium]|nr:MAG: hypothetical protein E6H07_14420 [Bacteroidota bacterium]
MKLYFILVTIILLATPETKGYDGFRLLNSNENISTCRKAIETYNSLANSFSKGVYIYSAKRVQTSYSDGKAKYKVKGKNKSIQFLINFTHIKCDESENGTYVITKEVLVEWSRWLNSNCKEESERIILIME